MPRLIWSKGSVRDIQDIDIYLDQFHPDYGVRAQEAIRTSARLLADYPRAGPRMGSDEFRSLRVRGTPYVIVYRILSDAIEIARIRHEREDWRPE